MLTSYMKRLTRYEHYMDNMQSGGPNIDVGSALVIKLTFHAATVLPSPYPKPPTPHPAY